uniref:Uncharacterized protein n=1 Tax=Solanum lycopersicum TaxID=4081 RepID=A0A3Q7EDX0_SOLLC
MKEQEVCIWIPRSVQSRRAATYLSYKLNTKSKSLQFNFNFEHDVVLVSVRECRVLFDSSYRSEHFYAASEIDGEDAQAKVLVSNAIFVELPVRTRSLPPRSTIHSLFVNLLRLPALMLEIYMRIMLHGADRKLV